MLANIAQAHHAVDNAVMDVLKKNPTDWNFDWDVKFDWGHEDKEQKPRRHERFDRQKHNDEASDNDSDHDDASDSDGEEDHSFWHKVFGHTMHDKHQPDDEEFHHRGKFWWVRHDEVEEDTEDPDYCPPHADCDGPYDENHW